MQGMPATQPWVHELTIMQQSVLLGSVRGPDGIGKYHTAKFLLRWFRRCVLVSALDGVVLATPYAFGGGSFTGPSYDATTREHDWRPTMDRIVDCYLQSLDELPHHFQMHFIHAAEILGFKHPDQTVREWWNGVYLRLVHDLHLWPETEDQLDRRLGDDRGQWLERNDAATVD
ncbi:hypothetical protein ACWX0K_10865 [Nitrobacteraceae bacterium UC4446_H13]